MALYDVSRGTAWPRLTGDGRALGGVHGSSWRLRSRSNVVSPPSDLLLVLNADQKMTPITSKVFHCKTCQIDLKK
eukprot:578382-Lingulodinium_polyedra.AAC.1